MGTSVKKKKKASWQVFFFCRAGAAGGELQVERVAMAIQELLRAAAGIISMEHRSGMIMSGGNGRRKWRSGLLLHLWTRKRGSGGASLSSGLIKSEQVEANSRGSRLQCPVIGSITVISRRQATMHGPRVKVSVCVPAKVI